MRRQREAAEGAGVRPPQAQESAAAPGPHHPAGDVPAEPSRIPAAVLPTIGALLLAWALATLVDDVAWGPLSILPVGLASLSPLLAVPALIVITLAVRRRHWVAVVPAAAAAVLPWTFMIGYLVPAPAVQGPTKALRAMLVTARNGAAHAGEISAVARAQAADLVVVTELTPALAHDLTTAGLARTLAPRYVSVPEGGPASAGLAIYSRYPMEEVHPLPGTQWPAVLARVTAEGTRVTLMAGHAVQPSMDHLDGWRTDLAAFETAARVKGPVLVLANLNATPWHPQFRRLVSGRLHDAADVLGRGLRPTWPAWSVVPMLPTDHALVAGLGVTTLETVAISGTDHRALLVEVRVPMTPESRPSR
jgi:endonuclease/exonuclease/phosphatase (EEP) superfamily protein YafD